jgi:hypothetical protein
VLGSTADAEPSAAQTLIGVSVTKSFFASYTQADKR